MFTITYKGFAVACETAQDAVEFCDAADQPTKPKAAAKATTRATPSRAEKDKRNAKAREAYRKKQEEKKKKEKGSTTTSRLEALPSQPTAAQTGRGFGTGKGKPKGQKRARTSQAVIATLQRSPQPLTLEEIDMDLEKSGWPYKGADRKGAIRATLNRLKAAGTISTFLRGSGMDAMQMFRLERTNGDAPSPVEQVLNGPERGEEDKQEIAAEEARADAEGDPNALGPGQTPQDS